MKHLTATLLGLSSLALSSCVIYIGGDEDGIHFGHHHGIRGSGVRSEETRPVEPFTAVHVAGMGNVDIVIGEEPSLHLSGDDNIVPEIETFVDEGTLVIRMPEDARPREFVRLSISTPTLERVDLLGSGDIDIQGARGGELDLHLAGSGDIEARGRVDRVGASVHGSGDIALGDLRAVEASVEVSGSGDIAVYASENLEYSISGSGDVVIYGNPRMRGEISGSGTLHHR